MGDDDDLPLASLARQSKSKRRHDKKKQTRRKSRSASPKKSRSKSPSSKRQQKPKRAILKAYNLDGQFLGDVRDIADFVVEHRKEVPTKVGFVLLGSAAFPILIDKQIQLDAMPAGEYPAQIVYSQPSQEQLETFGRKQRTNAVAKASRLKQ